MEPATNSSELIAQNPPEVKNVDPNVNQGSISSPEKTEETPEQINWRKFRQQREIERKQAEEMAKRAQAKEQEAEALKAALDAVLNKNQNQGYQRQDNSYEEEETEEQRIEKKVQQALEKKEREYLQRKEEEERQSYPERIRQNHADFDQVCSTGNLDYLEYHYPEVASAFKYMPEGFDKWNNIYKAVKKFVPNTDTRQDEKRMERNLAKPGSLSSATVSTSGNPMPAYRLDEQRKAENWARMKAAMNKLG